jgi:hypothetical protein
VEIEKRCEYPAKSRRAGFGSWPTLEGSDR